MDPFSGLDRLVAPLESLGRTAGLFHGRGFSEATRLPSTLCAALLLGGLIVCLVGYRKTPFRVAVACLVGFGSFFLASSLWPRSTRFDWAPYPVGAVCAALGLAFPALSTGVAVVLAAGFLGSTLSGKAGRWAGFIPGALLGASLGVFARRFISSLTLAAFGALLVTTGAVGLLGRTGIAPWVLKYPSLQLSLAGGIGVLAFAYHRHMTPSDNPPRKPVA